MPSCGHEDWPCCGCGDDLERFDDGDLCQGCGEPKDTAYAIKWTTTATTAWTATTRAASLRRVLARTKIIFPAAAMTPVTSGDGWVGWFSPIHR